MKLHGDILLLKKDVHEAQQQVEDRKRKLERMNETVDKQREEIRTKQTELDINTFNWQETKDTL